MSEFNAEEFGENIKKYRKQKELTQENLATSLGTTKATISRFESGTMIPNAKEIHQICDELGIYESDLFERNFRFSNRENISNPFKTNILYIYFNAYNGSTKKFNKDKWLMEIREKEDRTEVDFINIHTNKVYATGYMLSDKMVAFISLENYKPNRNRLDVSEFVIKISEGVDDLMMGAYLGTNGNYYPSLRKCYFSKNDIEFTDEMLEHLKPTKMELDQLKENFAIYFDIFND